MSADPRETIRYAREFLGGLQRCAGSRLRQALSRAWAEPTSTAITLCPRSTERGTDLWNEDLVPYREMRKEFPFVMVAHVSYPKITGDRFLHRFRKSGLPDILRKRIGYRGLVISDDLDMGGVLNGASIEEAAVETLAGGLRYVSRLPERRPRVAGLRGCVQAGGKRHAVRQAGGGEGTTCDRL